MFMAVYSAVRKGLYVNYATILKSSTHLNLRQRHGWALSFSFELHNFRHSTALKVTDKFYDIAEAYFVDPVVLQCSVETSNDVWYSAK